MRYRIQIEAPLSHEVLAAFPELSPIDPMDRDNAGTTLAGEIRDQAHLHTIIGRIQTFGLGLAGVERLPD